MKVYRLGELFAGAGGMALGAHKAQVDGYGFRHVWANDIDCDACETLKRNVPVGKVFCEKVENLCFENLPKIDGLVFGFPCNDFSIVGKRKGIDDSGAGPGRHPWRRAQP